MGRNGRGEGNLFDRSEPEDEVPGLDELIRGSALGRRPRRHEPWPFGDPRVSKYIRSRPAVRRGIVVVRLVLAGGLLALGLLMTVVGAAGAATHYARAGTLASAPVCPATVDPTTTTEDCMEDLTLVTMQRVWTENTEEGLVLFRPPLSSDDYFTASFPGDAAFFNAVNDPFDAGAGQTAVRAEFWQGDLVALTAGGGADAVTVTTDSSPGNQAGTALAAALMGLAFTEFGLLLFYSVRAVRLRWSRPGLGRRLLVTGLLVTGLGLFIAGVCLINQPARVGITVILAPMVTLVVLLAVGAAQTAHWFGPGRGRARGIPTRLS